MKTKNLKLIAAMTLSLAYNVASSQDTNTENLGQANSTPCVPLASPWYLGGNNIQGGNAACVNCPPPYYSDAGTCNNYPFVLKANNNKSVFIMPSGNIGIGAINPAQLLHLQKTGDATLRIDAIGNAGKAWDLVSSAGQGQINSGNFGIFDTQASTFRFNIDNGGNVGIGSLSPICKLEVRDAANTDIYSYSTNSNGTAGLWALNGTTNYGLRIDGNGVGQISQNATSPLNLMSFNWNNSLSTPKAQVWIGKKPTTGNHVDFDFAAPKIVANEIYVFNTGNWADYVFDKNYTLLPLTELEQYVKKNKHLPDVPSETEVINNGMSVTQMNVVLLKKVEELTLYLIDLKKEMEGQKLEIGKLKEKAEK